MTTLFIIYFIGTFLAWCICIYHVKKTYLYITLNDIILFIIGGLFSWLFIACWLINWLITHGDDIILYKFKH
jgi:hypothetical protein